MILKLIDTSLKELLKDLSLFDHVYCLNDGEEAYHHFKNIEESQSELGEHFPPSIVILDINMPRMNGFEFLEKFKDLPIGKETSTIFVAMLTSSKVDIDQQKAMEYPFVQLFFIKAF